MKVLDDLICSVVIKKLKKFILRRKARKNITPKVKRISEDQALIVVIVFNVVAVVIIISSQLKVRQGSAITTKSHCPKTSARRIVKISIWRSPKRNIPKVRLAPDAMNNILTKRSTSLLKA